MEHKFIKVQRVSNIPIREDERYEVTEKVDGANFSFYVDCDGSLVFRSRNRELLDGLETGKGWTRCVEFLTDVHGKTPFLPDFIYFGECMTKHTIFYGETHAFIGFAVMDANSEEYIGNWNDHYNERNIPHVPISYLMGNEIMDYVKEHLDDKSEYGTTDATQEGLVFKCYKTQEFVKYVREQFKEDNRDAFRGKLSPEDDTGKIVLRFCTHGRIEKHVYAIRDEFDMVIGIEMMQHLPKIVCEDIINEEFKTIYNKYSVVDFKKFRKMVAKECVRYFTQMEMQQ